MGGGGGGGVNALSVKTKQKPEIADYNDYPPPPFKKTHSCT